MDPKLKAALSGLRRGTKEYQAAFDKFMANEAKTQGEAEERKARIDRERGDAEAERIRKANETRETGERLAREAQSVKDRNTSLITAGVASGGAAAGLVGGYAADRYGSAKANKVLEGRSEGARNLAAAARGIDPSQPGARMRYNEIATAADKTGVLKPRVVPYGGLGVAAGLTGAGLYSTLHRAPQAQSDEEKALWTGMGYGELGAGAKMLASSAHRYMNPGVTLPPEAVADIEFARRQGAGTGPIGGYDQRPPSAPSGGGTPPANPQSSQPPKVPNAQRLIAAAKAAGATGSLTKDGAAKYLMRGINDSNRAAVARELGVNSGPNFATRTKAAFKNMAKTRGVSSVAFPVIAGAAAYDASMNQAEASGEQPSRGRSAATGLGAAGMAAAIPYAISKLPAVIGRGLSAAMPMMAPSGIDAMTDYTPDELNRSAHWQLENLPSWALSSGVKRFGEMSQVPERNPIRPMPMNMGGQGEDFESVLNELSQYLQPQEQAMGAE